MISGTAASAFDTGQLAFAWAFASSWNVASSHARNLGLAVSDSILLDHRPGGQVHRGGGVDAGGREALVPREQRRQEHRIAAGMRCADQLLRIGFVPFAYSKKQTKVYGPSK